MPHEQDAGTHERFMLSHMHWSTEHDSRSSIEQVGGAHLLLAHLQRSAGHKSWVSKEPHVVRVQVASAVAEAAVYVHEAWASHMERLTAYMLHGTPRHMLAWGLK